MLCVVATWSRHARLHIKRRSSSSRRQTEPTHSKRGRNGRRTPSRPQKTDDRTHLHACPVCRESLSRATPAPLSIVSYDEWHLILFCVKLRGCRWRRSPVPIPSPLSFSLSAWSCDFWRHQNRLGKILYLVSCLPCLLFSGGFFFSVRSFSVAHT